MTLLHSVWLSYTLTTSVHWEASQSPNNWIWTPQVFRCIIGVATTLQYLLFACRDIPLNGLMDNYSKAIDIQPHKHFQVRHFAMTDVADRSFCSTVRVCLIINHWKPLLKIETIKHIVKLQKAYDNILTNANLLRNQENKNVPRNQRRKRNKRVIFNMIYLSVVHRNYR